MCNYSPWLKVHLCAYLLSYICVRVFLWAPVSIPCPNYEVVRFQPQAVYIPDLGYVHPLSTFPSPPKSNIRSSEDTILIHNRQWAHLWPPEWASGCPNNLGTIYYDYYLIPTRYERQLLLHWFIRVTIG